MGASDAQSSEQDLHRAVEKLRALGFDARTERGGVFGTYPSPDDTHTKLPDGRTLTTKKSSFALYVENGEWLLGVTKAGTALIADTRHTTLADALKCLVLLFTE